MSKEWLQEKFNGMVFGLAVKHFRSGLKAEAIPAYLEMMRKIKGGEKVIISDLMNLLTGYTLHAFGLEQFEELKDRAFILVVNHFHGGPIRGFWQVVAINHLVREKTGQEPHWVQGSGSQIVAPIHEMVATSTNNIAVGGGAAGVREIERTLHNKMVVAIHPEGEPSVKLRRGDYRTGRILLHAAKRNIPILCTAVWSQNNDLFVNMSQILHGEAICKLVNSADDVRASGQLVVDHVMGILAQRLPPPLRGHYVNPVDR